MKRVELLDLEDSFKTADLLLAAVKDASQTQGADFDEQVRRCRIITAVQALPGGAIHLDLEDADFDKAKALMKAYRWAMADPRIEKIIRSFSDSKKPAAIARVGKVAAE